MENVNENSPFFDIEFEKNSDGTYKLNKNGQAQVKVELDFLAIQCIMNYYKTKDFSDELLKKFLLEMIDKVSGEK